MAVIISGSSGIQNPLGSASAPSESNTSSATTGIYYPTSTTLGLSTNGTNAVTIDASQNVGIGTTSPVGVTNYHTLTMNGTSGGIVYLQNNGTTVSQFSGDSGATNVATLNATPLTFQTNAIERMRIDSSGIVTGTAGNLMLVSGTSQATTSGTSVTFTGIPSWVKRITVVFGGVSTSGTNFMLLQIGTGGTPTTTGYSAQTTGIASSSGASSSSTSGFPIYTNVATYAWSGSIVLNNLSGNIWVASGVLGNATTTPLSSFTSGLVTLSGTLNVVTLTTVGGTDTFDAGSINIQYE